MAAALDASIILMALAIFGIIFHLAGGAFVLNAKTAPMFLGVAAGVVIFYRLLWCLANGDTRRPKVDASAAGEFRRPDAHSHATALPGCIGLLELDGRRHRIAVGPGGRRDAHLARSHFQDLPHAGQLDRELKPGGRAPRSRTWIPCCLASADRPRSAWI